MSGPILFMGEMPDPDLDTAIARGFPRIYDATKAPTEADLRLVRDYEAERAKRPPYTGERGSLTLTGGGPCVCGRCLFEYRCPAVTP